MARRWSLKARLGWVQSFERAAAGADESTHRIDYTGAVYGSLLAASVVAGTGHQPGAHQEGGQFARRRAAVPCSGWPTAMRGSSALDFIGPG
jgi:hypothetical protein